VEARALGRRPWGRTSTLFAVIQKRVLSKNFDQYMLKNTIFLKKDAKNRPSVGGSAPEPPLLPVAGSKFWLLFFTSNSVVFVDRGRKNISCPRAQDTLAPPLIIISPFL